MNKKVALLLCFVLLVSGVVFTSCGVKKDTAVETEAVELTEDAQSSETLAEEEVADNDAVDSSVSAVADANSSSSKSKKSSKASKNSAKATNKSDGLSDSTATGSENNKNKNTELPKDEL